MYERPWLLLIIGVASIHAFAAFHPHESSFDRRVSNIAGNNFYDKSFNAANENAMSPYARVAGGNHDSPLQESFNPSASYRQTDWRDRRGVVDSSGMFETSEYTVNQNNNIPQFPRQDIPRRQDYSYQMEQQGQRPPSQQHQSVYRQNSYSHPQSHRLPMVEDERQNPGGYQAPVSGSWWDRAGSYNSAMITTTGTFQTYTDIAAENAWRDKNSHRRYSNPDSGYAARDGYYNYPKATNSNKALESQDKSYDYVYGNSGQF